MDVGFYLELQKMAPRSPNIPEVPKLNISTPYIYSPFHPITVKLMMLPPTIQVGTFTFTSKESSGKSQKIKIEGHIKKLPQ